MAIESKSHPGFLYVTSWEVCNRLGGVHTMLETGAPSLQSYYGDNLLYVGPDLWAQRAVQAAFGEDRVQPPVAAIAAERDIPVRFGRWHIDGKPRAALVDFGRLLERKNEILGDLWNDHRVDSIHADWDSVERILFGYAAGMLIELHYHSQVRPRGTRAVAHFHQWITGAGLLRLADRAPELGTVYTPHGTALGRSLAAGGIPLHRDLDRIVPVEAARERRMAAQHTLEVATAKKASVLTSVSEHSAEEIRHILGRGTDLVTPNGYRQVRKADPAKRDEVRESIFRNAERFLGAPIDRENTRMVLSSGPYQVPTKGIDVALRALARLRDRDGLSRRLLYVIAMATNQTGPRPDTLRRIRSEELAGKPCGICTHNLAHPETDPILSLCRELDLRNDPGDPVQVIFVPVLIDGRDAFLPHSYAEVLQACDATLFPSLYEPWGYTPIESLASGVLTATTDLTGFGRFALALPEEERMGVIALPRSHLDGEELETTLADEVISLLGLGQEQGEPLRCEAGRLLERTSWDELIVKTLEAHKLALRRGSAHRGSTTSPGLSPISRRSVIVISTGGADRPQLHRFTVSARLPENLTRLGELAHNLWWCWNPEATALLRGIAPDLWEETGGNPVGLLRRVDPGRLAECARDEGFLADHERVLAGLDAYKARPEADVPSTTYFCAEFALHESLPIYSGGLGVLAGDHLKSASDLALPLSAVGLRYRHGYFVQRIQPGGDQGAHFQLSDMRDMPMEEVTDEAAIHCA